MGSPYKRIWTVVLCALLVLLTLLLLAVAGAWMGLNTIFNGPSPSARDALAVSLMKTDTTSWIPPLFLDEQTLLHLNADEPILQPEPTPEEPQIDIEYGNPSADPWADFPDGIRMETHYGRTYTAHVMLIRDPSAVYLGTSSTSFSIDKLGNRIFAQMKQEGALAAINGGAFNDDGTANSYIGSLPIGMVVSKGQILWDDGKSYDGFVGLTEDHKLVVSDTIDREKVKELNIRDGCCFGPVFVKDGELNTLVYDMDTTYNARTAIGQRADGTIIFLCIDGRQAGSMGATYADAMELMKKLGAVNACNLDGGASTVMTRRDASGKVVQCGSYALIQASPRRMPTFFMVRPTETED